MLRAVFLVIRAQVSQDHPPRTDHRSGHAGAGGARSRVMHARICPNIRPDTATSAIWNVMTRAVVGAERMILGDLCPDDQEYRREHLRPPLVPVLEASGAPHLHISTTGLP